MFKNLATILCGGFDGDASINANSIEILQVKGFIKPGRNQPGKKTQGFLSLGIYMSTVLKNRMKYNQCS